MEKKYYKYRDNKYDTRGPYRTQPLEAGKSVNARPNLVYAIPTPWGSEVMPKRQWLWKRERVLTAIENDDLVFNQDGDSATISYKQYLRDEDGKSRSSKPTSVIDGVYTQHGTANLLDVFGNDHVFQFPKPVALVRRFLEIGGSDHKEDIILDFFAGSGTQAVLELNQTDGGNRSFIGIQIPDKTPENSVAAQAGFATIAEITKERIRRVSAKLKAAGATGDLGFRVLKLDRSNLLRWRSTTSERELIDQAGLLSLKSTLVQGWKRDHVLTELMLMAGYPLDSSISRSPAFAPSQIGVISHPEMAARLLVCLDEGPLDEAIADVLANGEYNRDTFVCLDNALDDELKERIADQVKVKTL
jgi:adenine-specific DNA-methyltransferase